VGVQLYVSESVKVSLPWPAHDQPIRSNTNVTVHRTASNLPYTVKHGPEYYQITRVFESLTDAQTAALYVFFKTIGWMGGTFYYRYRDTKTGTDKSVLCRLIEEPQQTKKMNNIRDVTLAMEQSSHPDSVTDPAL
jgi:hypothetical protein